MTASYTKYCQQIGYTFSDESLLRQALRHRSCGNHNNERLEFLGDAILGFVIAEELYRRFPLDKEGILTRFRSHIVKGDTLSQVALELGIPDIIEVGPGELKSGGYRRESILADSVEATIGAIYLDSGLDSARSCILRLFDKYIRRLDKNEFGKDAKTRLQEWLQKRSQTVPTYDVLSIDGKDHNQVFHVSCTIESPYIQTNGRGSSRKKAEQQAAERALNNIYDK